MAGKVHKLLIEWSSEIIKKQRDWLPLKQRSLDYSNVYSNVTIKMVTSMEPKQKYYVLHSLYTNSKISVGLPYLCAHSLFN